MKVFVLGAGMSGLATAEHLIDCGFGNVEILELTEKVGGLGASFSWGDFENNDLGPHIWHTPNTAIANEWKKRFSNYLVEGKFWGKNVIGDAPGEYFDYPLSIKTLSQFDDETRKVIEKELENCSEEKLIKANNFNDYVEALVGPTLSKMFFKDYPEKLWGVKTEEMTANWAPKRINFTKTPREFHIDQWAAVGKYGSGGVMDLIYKSYLNKGGKISFNSKVTGIEFNGKTITAIQLNDKNLINIQPDDKIVSTIPFHVLANYLGIKNELEYRGAKLVYISVDAHQVIPGKPAFLYFPQKHIVFHRLSEQKKFSSFGWPKNRTTLVAEIAYSDGDDTFPEDNRIIDLVVDGLVEFKLISQGQILDTLCLSLPCVYPLLTHDKEIEFKKVLAKVQDFSQVYLIGTGGEFHYADLQILYAKAKDLAERIKEESHNPFGVTLPTENRRRTQDGFFPSKPFIIAEIGLNHGGNINVAKELILKAKSSGAKFIKFQTYKTESRISQVYRSNNYSEEVIDTENSLFKMFKNCEFTHNEWAEIFTYGKENDVSLFSAVFDADSLDLLESLNCPAYKIASMDVNNYPLIKKIAKTGKPVVLSTGMSTLGEIEKAISYLKSGGVPELIVLHCISSYPASSDSINLNAMKTLSTAFGFPVGFSDHTIGVEAAIVAISLGAVCVEKHFTLDKTLEGPDHIFSLIPSELEYLINMSKEVPLMLGNSANILTRQEVETSFKFKKSLHAAKKISKGEIFTEDNVCIKGPYGGIAPEHYEIVIGRKSLKDIENDYPIGWDSF
jgi:sialic acid synthase SpsE/UDP-galactopyranose mutase